MRPARRVRHPGRGTDPRRWLPSVALALVAALAVGAGSSGVTDAAFVSVTSNDGSNLAASATFPRYREAVTADAPSFDYRMDDDVGTGRAADESGGTEGYYNVPYGFGRSGAIGDGDSAIGFRPGGSQTGIHDTNQLNDPEVFTLEIWFRTTAGSGGKLIGFGDRMSGASGNYDRHVYMLDDGRLAFGVYDGGTSTVVTPSGYKDGSWHQVVASQGADGMSLYVDGALKASDSNHTTAQPFAGYSANRR